MRLRPVRAWGLLAVLALVGAACSGGDGGARVDDLLEQALAPGERPIQFAGANGLQLSGTLTVPTAATVDTKAPVVLFVPTLGPGDRDGPIGAGGVPDRVYLDLSNELVARGFATFRYDRRGTGLSKLDDDDGPVRLADVVADAEAGVEFLAERAEVDPARISVMAFDQGGLVAMRVAAADSRVSRLVLLSAPGRPLVEVIADELRPQFGEATVADLRRITAGLVRSGQLPDLDAIPSEFRLYLADDNPAFLSEVFAIDPVAEVRGLRTPTLIVVSGVAPGVSRVDADLLARAIGPSAEVAVAPTAGPTLQTYTFTTIVDPSDPAAGTGHEHDQSVIPTSLAEREGPIVTRILTWLGAVQ